MAADPTVMTLSGNPIVEEARKRWQRCQEWESDTRAKFVNDIKFRHGDSDNGYQWPNQIKRSRDTDQKPCLTMNLIQQHNLQISNQAKQNKSSVKIVAMGGGATQESANVFKGLTRHIEYQSNAQAAYSTALDFAVDGGIGWWRIVTDYADNESFEQEIYVRRLLDPLSVFIDPDCQEKDKSDAKFGFVYDLVPKDDFKEMYPKYKDLGGEAAPLGLGVMDDLVGKKDMIWVCEYFRKVEKSATLVSFVDPTSGERKQIKKSALVKAMKDQADLVLDDPLTKTRSIEETKIEWFLIASEEVIDRTVWPGKYIPLVPVIGIETTIDGRLDRKGHTRAMLDAQRMYNYSASAEVEFVALQGKTPWIAPAKAIEEYESMWNTANLVNHSVLVWNHVDDENPDKDIPPPQRQEPPKESSAYQTGMDTAFNQMMMSSGQWQNQMGMAGNERTGKAIQERQQQSDTSVFHFQDNFEMTLRLTGKMLIDLIPKIYDTKRIVKIMADDGEDEDIEIDPSSRQAFVQHQNHNGQVIRRIFNPAVGKYDVAAEVGPAYGTKRQETVEALTLILTQNPGLTGIVGDLLLESMDFDKAQEAARRMKRMVPPLALGKGPSQDEQKLQQQVGALQGALAKSLEAHGKDKLRLVGKAEMRDIDAYKAETDRFKALSDSLGLDESGVRQVIEQLVEESRKNTLSPLIDANKDEFETESGTKSLAMTQPQAAEQPPVNGARKAPDGEWYLADPTRRGKYLRVAPLAQQRSVRS